MHSFRPLFALLLAGIFLSPNVGRAAVAPLPPSVAAATVFKVGSQLLSGCTNISFRYGPTPTMTLLCPLSQRPTLEKLAKALFRGGGSDTVLIEYNNPAAHSIKLFDAYIDSYKMTTTGFTISIVYRDSTQT